MKREWPISETTFANELCELPAWNGLCEDTGMHPFAVAFHLLEMIRDAGYEVTRK